MTTGANQDSGAMPPQPPMPVICDSCRAHGSAGGEGFAEIADILNFEPVPRRTQVNNWTAELQRAFVAALAITGSERRAGKAIGRHEYGAQKLRKARGGKGFDEACEAALQIYRDREMARLADQMGELKNASLEQVQRMDRSSGEGDGDEGPGYEEYQEAQARNRERMLRARRLYLLAISVDEAKRAAWETLAGPVDWEKAVALKPQANEPYPPRMVEPDMLLATEGGCLPEMVGSGRDRLKEYKEALAEAKAALASGRLDRDSEEEIDGPKTRRFFDADVPGEDG